MSRTQMLAIMAGVIVFALVVGGIVLLGSYGREGPGEREQAVWPLTGERAPGREAVLARVVSVKVENSPAARPQDGIAEADVIYETLTEGGITRFNVLYHSQAPDRVGPVRSARLSDLHVVSQYRAVFARAGANSLVEERMREQDVEDVNALRRPAAFERSAEREAPHNLYADIPRVRDEAEALGYPAEEDPPELGFGAAPTGGTAAGTVTLPFSAASLVRWTWDAQARGWKREMTGEAQTDEGSSEQYAFENVVVLFAETEESERPGTLDIDLSGSGDAAVFRDGKRYDGRWEAGNGSPPRLRTESGEDLPLAVGSTWFEVVPAGFDLGE